MDQCFRSVQAMLNVSFSPPEFAPLKRKSFGDINEQPPKRRAIASPAERQSFPSARSFGAHNTAATTTTNQPINIQPRPSPNGLPALSPSTSSPPVSAPVATAVPPGRKRGRPSKADREMWARTKQPQPGVYTTISPVPIAPSPVAPTAQPAYSPSPSTTSAYQVSPGTAPEPKPRKQGRAQAADRKKQADNVPRTVQGGPESVDRKTPSAPDHGWRDNARSVDQNRAGNPSPVPLEPPVQPQRQPTNQPPIHSPHTTLLPAASHRNDPPVEHTRAEGNPRVSNQA